ncbi:Sucrase/ferredoxin-like-domain-containing protein [Coprinopsis sp. MPI-PUGE-AT-0042]|nr:Sucrase/ferredoxin-like-domain-containing protein [Coprinopsis sp. MPI-PUGE-AT-0042]
MLSLRRLSTMVFGHDDVDPLCGTLKSVDVPISSADCRSCSDPCDLGHHDAYPRRFDIDMDTDMLGSIKPYHRQIVISTGKSDWERDITDNATSLAAYMSDVVKNANSPKASLPQRSRSHGRGGPKAVNGLFNTSDSVRTSILNGSHRTVCHEDDHETVLVFPDFKMVSEVRRAPQGAQDLWDGAVRPELDRKGALLEKHTLKSWVLPYACVILLCSHKKRDNRCGIAAPKLEHAFIKTLEAQGWDADTDVEHPSVLMGPPLEDLPITDVAREQNMATQLKESTESKRALIVKVSHVGGHKYAGNCIIYTPSGAGVWYGRVTPHDVDSIVENTIIKGLVLPPLLRGGLNLSKPNCKSLNDW